MSKQNDMQFNCLVGEPYQDVNGEWRCTDIRGTNNPPLTQQVPQRMPSVYTVPTTAGNATSAFSLVEWVQQRPLLSAGIAGAAIFLLWMYFNKK